MRINLTVIVWRETETSPPSGRSFKFLQEPDEGDEGRGALAFKFLILTVESSSKG